MPDCPTPCLSSGRRAPRFAVLVGVCWASHDKIQGGIWANVHFNVCGSFNQRSCHKGADWNYIFNDVGMWVSNPMMNLNNPCVSTLKCGPRSLLMEQNAPPRGVQCVFV